MTPASLALLSRATDDAAPVDSRLACLSALARDGLTHDLRDALAVVLAAVDDALGVDSPVPYRVTVDGPDGRPAEVRA